MKLKSATTQSPVKVIIPPMTNSVILKIIVEIGILIDCVAHAIELKHTP